MNKRTLLALLVGLATAASVRASSEAASEDEARKEIARLAASQMRTMAARDSEGGAGFSGLGVGMFLAASGDVATTEWGLGRPGIYEANPIMKNRTVRISTHAVVPTVVWWASSKLHQDGKHKLAWAMRIAVVAAYGYATLHNYRTISSVK
jgi:hypothetical protein